MRRTFRPAILPGIALLMTLALSVAACGTDNPPSTDPPATSAAPPGTTSTPAPDGVSSPDATITPAPASTATAEPAFRCTEVRSWTTGKKESDPYVKDELYNVRTGRHDCYDRIVFDINGPAEAGYHVSYVPLVTADGSGAPVKVDGRAFLQVIVHAWDFSHPQFGHRPGRKPWKVGDTLAKSPSWKALREVKYAGAHEGQTTFAVGVSARTGFLVTTWREDAVMHVIIDIAHPS
jgi:hypothetical protein